MAFPENVKPKEITNQEAAIKIKLKAELIREGVPIEFRPSKEIVPIKAIMNREPEQSPVAKELDNKQSINPNKESLSKAAAPSQESGVMVSQERKDWYVPATEKMQAFRASVERVLVSQTQDELMVSTTKSDSIFGHSFNRASVGEQPEKRATNQEVIQQTSIKAERLRENVPPEYKKEFDSKVNLQGARMAGAFNSAAAPDKKEPSSSWEPDCKP
jgi:pyruvate-formate lyase